MRATLRLLQADAADCMQAAHDSNTFPDSKQTGTRALIATRLLLTGPAAMLRHPYSLGLLA
jgi:hypothetical protein